MELFIYILIILLTLGILYIFIWSIFDIVKSDISSTAKGIWIICVMLFGFFTSIIWYFARPAKKVEP